MPAGTSMPGTGATAYTATAFTLAGNITTGNNALSLATPVTLNTPVTISAGKIQFNSVGTGPGGVDVLSGAVIGGSGSVPGAVVVESGGHISPHDAPTGTATLTLGALTNNPTAVLDFNFGTFGDSVNLLGNCLATAVVARWEGVDLSVGHAEPVSMARTAAS